MRGQNSTDKTSLDIDSEASKAMQLPANGGLLNFPGDLPIDRADSFHRRLENAFTELIADELSRERPKLSYAVSQGVKVWLYDTGQPWDLQGYDVPYFDQRDLEIPSPVTLSKLERIYVLSNGRSGQEYDEWKAVCETWFRPLFRRFIAPQEPPDVLNKLMVMRFGQALTNRLYLCPHMQKNMLFNALVIQAG